MNKIDEEQDSESGLKSSANGAESGHIGNEKNVSELGAIPMSTTPDIKARENKNHYSADDLNT